MIAFYVTSHGYGHATRASALAAELMDRRPDLKLEIRTLAPAWIFQEMRPGLPVVPDDADRGLVQRDAFDVDMEASLAAQIELDGGWERRVEEEAQRLRQRGVKLVVADIAPLAFAAAGRAAIPSIGVSNFCWDWVFAPYAAADPRWEPARRRCAEAYSCAELGIRLPLSGDFPSFRRVVDVPLLSRRGKASAADWRAGRGLTGDDRPIVLLAFGGFDAGPLAFEAADDLRSYVFAGFGPRPEGLSADWIELTSGTSHDQLETMAACDVVLSKPGYGIISEALAHGKRMIYIPRAGYREADVLVAGVEARGACLPLSRADYVAGRWCAALEAIMRVSPPAPVPIDGASVAAGLILERLGR